MGRAKDLDGDDYQWLDEQGSPTPPYRDIEAMAIFADVDLEDEVKTRPLDNETREVFERVLAYYVEALCDLTGSDPGTCEHVKLLDSVGGAYPFVPPRPPRRSPTSSTAKNGRGYTKNSGSG